MTSNYEILEKMSASSEFEAKCDLKYVHPDIHEANKLEQDLRLIQEEVAYIEANPVQSVENLLTARHHLKK